MPGIVPEDIERYALEHTTPVEDRMDALAEETRATLETPAPRGVIVVDNTLWSGRVLRPEADDASESTRALAAFNDMIVNDERVVCVMLTIRDGVTLIRPAPTR